MSAKDQGRRQVSSSNSTCDRAGRQAVGVGAGCACMQAPHGAMLLKGSTGTDGPTMPKLYTSLAAVAFSPSSTSGACRGRAAASEHAGNRIVAASRAAAVATPSCHPRPPPLLASQMGLVAPPEVRLLSGCAPSSSLDRLKSSQVRKQVQEGRGGER